MTTTASDIGKNDIVQRFIALGVKEELVFKWSEEALTAMEKEPEEIDLLIKAIKNYSKEKKA
jgi:hypothetical protein